MRSPRRRLPHRRRQRRRHGRSNAGVKYALFILLASCALARATVESDLAGIYATTAAQPGLKFDGPLSRRVASILQKQANYLVGQLHPWDQDPHALLLT